MLTRLKKFFALTVAGVFSFAVFSVSAESIKPEEIKSSGATKFVENIDEVQQLFVSVNKEKNDPINNIEVGNVPDFDAEKISQLVIDYLTSDEVMNEIAEFSDAFKSGAEYKKSKTLETLENEGGEYYNELMSIVDEFISASPLNMEFKKMNQDVYMKRGMKSDSHFVECSADTQVDIAIDMDKVLNSQKKSVTMANKFNSKTKSSVVKDVRGRAQLTGKFSADFNDVILLNVVNSYMSAISGEEDVQNTEMNDLWKEINSLYIDFNYEISYGASINVRGFGGKLLLTVNVGIDSEIDEEFVEKFTKVVNSTDMPIQDLMDMPLDLRIGINFYDDDNNLTFSFLDTKSFADTVMTLMALDSDF